MLKTGMRDSFCQKIYEKWKYKNKACWNSECYFFSATTFHYAVALEREGKAWGGWISAAELKWGSG